MWGGRKWGGGDGGCRRWRGGRYVMREVARGWEDGEVGNGWVVREVGRNFLLLQDIHFLFFNVIVEMISPIHKFLKWFSWKWRVFCMSDLCQTKTACIQTLVISRDKIV